MMTRQPHPEQQVDPQIIAMTSRILGKNKEALDTLDGLLAIERINGYVQQIAHRRGITPSEALQDPVRLEKEVRALFDTAVDTEANKIGDIIVALYKKKKP